MNFEKLAEEHKDAVYRQMVRMCGNADDAEDVLAESLMKAYDVMHQLNEAAAFRGWLAIIARRTCGRLKRREGLLHILRLTDLPAHQAEFPSGEATPEEQMLEENTKRCVREAISALPPLYGTVYQLADVEELPLKEIAERLSLTLPAVKSRLHRARQMVRESLDRLLREG